MRLRSLTVLGLITLTALSLPGCSNSPSIGTTPASPAAKTGPKDGKDGNQPQGTPLSSEVLRDRLLDENDLGTGYVRKPEHESSHDDVTVIGCPALDGLGGDAAAGGSLDFPRKANATFTYSGGPDSELAEELYSGTETKLSEGAGKIFGAMAACPVYQVVIGSTPIKVSTQKLQAAQLGDERWSQLMTFTAGGRDSVMKQVAVRTGTVLMVVSGSPGLVDAQVDKALAKAQAVR